MSDRIVSVDAEPILSTTSLVEEILPQSTCPKSPFDGPMVLPPHQSSFMAGSFDESLIPRSAEALVSRIQQEVLAELSEAQQSQVPMQSQAFHSNPQSAPVYVNSEATSIGPHSSAAQSILPVDAVPSQIPQEMPQAFTQTQAKIQQTRSEPQTVSMALVLVNRPPGYSTDVNHNGTSIPAQHTPIQQPYSVTVNPESQRGPGGDVSQAITETRIPQPVSHTYHQMPNPVSSTASHPANAPESSYTTPSETIYHPGPTYYVAAPVAGQPVAYAMPNAHSTAKYAITQSPTQANPHFGLIQYHSEPPQQTLYQPHMVTQPSSAAVGGSVFQPGQANMYQIPAFINPNLCGISFVPDKHGAAGHINQGNAAEYGAVQSNVGDPHYQHGPQNSATSNTPAGLIFQQSPMQQPHLGQQMSVMAIPTAGLVNSTQNVAPQASIQPYSSATTEAGTSVKPFQVTIEYFVFDIRN